MVNKFPEKLPEKWNENAAPRISFGAFETPSWLAEEVKLLAGETLHHTAKQAAGAVPWESSGVLLERTLAETGAGT